MHEALRNTSYQYNSSPLYSGLDANIVTYLKSEGLGLTDINSYELTADQSEAIKRLKPLVQEYVQNKSFEVYKRLNEAISILLFASLDALAIANPKRKTLFPWESYYLQKHDATVWSKELLKSAPKQIVLAKEWLISTVIPMDIVDMFEEIDLYQSKKKQQLLDSDRYNPHQEYREEMSAAADNYLLWMPTRLGSEAVVTLLYSLASSYPHLIPYIAMIATVFSGSDAISSADSYDSSNQMRRVPQIYAQILDKILQENTRYLAGVWQDTSVEVGVNQTANWALVNMESIDNYLKLLARTAGVSFGVIAHGIQNNSLVSALPISLASLVATVSVLTPLKKRQENLSTTFSNKIITFQTLKSQANRALAGDDKKRSKDYTHLAYETNRDLTKVINPFNAKLEFFSKAFPWVIAGLSSMLKNVSLVAIDATYLLTGQLLGASLVDAAGVTVRRNQSKNAAKIFHDNLRATVTTLKEAIKNKGSSTVSYDAEKRALSIGEVKLLNGKKQDLSAHIFKPGVHFLAGGSGTGKSTILREVDTEAEANVASAFIGKGTSDFLGKELITRLRQGKANGFFKYIDQFVDLTERRYLIEKIMRTRNISFEDAQRAVKNVGIDLANPEKRKILLDSWDTSYITNKTDLQSTVLDYYGVFYFKQYVAQADIQLMRQKIGSKESGSMGEINRIGLALAFLYEEAEIMVIDEPTANLDARNLKNISDKICEFAVAHPKMIILIASHEKELQIAFQRQRYHDHLRSVINLETGLSYRNDHDISGWLDTIFDTYAKQSSEIDVKVKKLLESYRSRFDNPITEKDIQEKRENIVGSLETYEDTFPENIENWSIVAEELENILRVIQQNEKDVGDEYDQVLAELLLRLAKSDLGRREHMVAGVDRNMASFELSEKIQKTLHNCMKIVTQKSSMWKKFFIEGPVGVLSNSYLKISILYYLSCICERTLEQRTTFYLGSAPIVPLFKKHPSYSRSYYRRSLEPIIDEATISDEFITKLSLYGERLSYKYDTSEHYNKNFEHIFSLVNNEKSSLEMSFAQLIKHIVSKKNISQVDKRIDYDNSIKLFYHFTDAQEYGDFLIALHKENTITLVELLRHCLKLIHIQPNFRNTFSSIFIKIEKYIDENNIVYTELEQALKIFNTFFSNNDLLMVKMQKLAFVNVLNYDSLNARRRDDDWQVQMFNLMQHIKKKIHLSVIHV